MLCCVVGPRNAMNFSRFMAAIGRWVPLTYWIKPFGAHLARNLRKVGSTHLLKAQKKTSSLRMQPAIGPDPKTEGFEILSFCGLLNRLDLQSTLIRDLRSYDSWGWICFTKSGQMKSRPKTRPNIPQMVVKSKGIPRLFQGNRSVGEILFHLARLNRSANLLVFVWWLFFNGFDPMG